MQRSTMDEIVSGWDVTWLSIPGREVAYRSCFFILVCFGLFSIPRPPRVTVAKPCIKVNFSIEQVRLVMFAL